MHSSGVLAVASTRKSSFFMIYFLNHFPAVRRIVAFTSTVFTGVVLAQTLPVLDAAQVTHILTSGKTPYALVARPLDVTQQRVDLVTLNPTTRQVIARGETSSIRCARLHAAASGEVLCLSNNVMTKGRFEFSAPYAATYSRDLNTQTNRFNEGSNARINRARISSDGKQQAWTYFIRGHNYMDAGSAQFSTLTQIHSPPSSTLQDVEKWPLTHKGAVVKAIDLNYWGVSFHPKNPQQFLVTAFFKGKAHLALGDLRSKTMRTIYEGVECPSYSPNGDTIAFKKRLSSTRWAPAILHLSTLKATVFNHIKESVDDQIDWLDAHTLLYEVVNTPLLGEASIDLMTLNTQAKAEPQRLWLKNARSAAVYLAQ
jgi:hypothetical protein